METETGLELFARLRFRPDLSSWHPKLFPEGSLSGRNVIEVSGPYGSGKTVILVDLLARALVELDLGGCGCEVFLIDLDHHLDIGRLGRSIRRLIVEKKLVPAADSDQITLKFLQRLRILRCFSLNDLFLALGSLETSLLHMPKTAMVFIDGVSSIYWHARTGGMQVHSFDVPILDRLATLINRITEEFGITAVITCQTLFRAPSFISKRAGKEFMDHFMGRIFKRMLTVRIKLSRPSADTGPKHFLGVITSSPAVASRGFRLNVSYDSVSMATTEKS